MTIEGVRAEPGIIKRNKGDVAGAIADFDRAVTPNPKNANAYRNRGVAKQKKGDNDGAIADFNERREDR
jgi:Flp pilus assembly protein TadD